MPTRRVAPKQGCPELLQLVNQHGQLVPPACSQGPLNVRDPELSTRARL